MRSPGVEERMRRYPRGRRHAQAATARTREGVAIDHRARGVGRTVDPVHTEARDNHGSRTGRQRFSQRQHEFLVAASTPTSLTRTTVSPPAVTHSGWGSW